MMSEEITVYGNQVHRELPVQSMSDVSQAGALIAQSGMLGARNPAEGFLIAATCLQEGMSFLKFGETYNIISGRISIKAEAMLSRLLELGGEYKVLARDPEKASVSLKYKSAEYTSTLTWADAQQESYTRQKDGRTLKDNWSTPRRRMQMLWARAVSDGVRVVCPLATRGTYTPEEVMDFDDPRGATATPINLPPVDTAPQVLPPARSVSMPSIPVAPSTPSTPADNAPTPFAVPAAADDGTDYTICRASGSYHGKPWAEIETGDLRLALGVVSPDITARDHEVIRAIIEKRNSNGKES